eukprot:ANDGO_06915.mRNA.1 Ultraviolet-B receptor UVR8
MSGRLYSYGRGVLGALGHGHFQDVRLPTLLPSLTNVQVSHIAAGWAHSAAITSSGDESVFPANSLLVWGRTHDSRSALSIAALSNTVPLLGMIANAFSKRNTVSSIVPSAVTAQSQLQFLSVACTAAATFAIDSTGSLWTFGENSFGRCGVRDPSMIFDPLCVWDSAKRGVRLIAVACGYSHTIVLDEMGRAYGFGKSDRGQTGVDLLRASLQNPEPVANSPATKQSPVVRADCVFSPTMIQDLAGEKIVKIAAGFAHSVALSSTGNVYIWGKYQGGTWLDEQDRQAQVNKTKPQSFLSKRFNVASAVPFPSDATRPRKMMAFSQLVVNVAAGQHHTLVETQDGKIWAFGMNRHGQVYVEDPSVFHEESAQAGGLAGDFATGNDRLVDLYGVTGGNKEYLFVLEPRCIFEPAENGVNQLVGGFSDSAIVTKDGAALRYSLGAWRPLAGTQDLRVTNLAIGWKHSLVVATPRA